MEATDQNKKPTTADPPAEIERLKEELRREHDMYLRALADFENYRRRVDRERSSTSHSGKREIILSLLGVLDGFDRALQHMSDAPRPVCRRCIANCRACWRRKA
jgi:molecular chaperone GrpE